MRGGDRFSEWVSRKIGSTLSIFLHTAAFLACFEAVFLGEAKLDTMLLALTTVVSLEAIYLSLFIQSSTNRHSDQSEYQAHQEYITTIRSEQNIERVLATLALMDSKKLDTILKLLVEPEMKARKRAVHAKRKR
jgi:uncharacterized membrane protein